MQKAGEESGTTEARARTKPHFTAAGADWGAECQENTTGKTFLFPKGEKLTIYVGQNLAYVEE